MAHIEKYKAHSVGHMLAHYRRDPSSLERDNIDPTRTGRNVTFGRVRILDEHGRPMLNDAGGERWRVQPVDWKPNWDTVSERIERVNADARAAGKRATRKDAVVMADVVVTLPRNVPPRDSDRFFKYTYMWLGKKLGRDNMMGGFVHRDEVRKDGSPVRDHMHAPFTPIMDGRFNYKQMVPRSFYKSMHKELGDYLEQKLGYRPEVELEAKTVADKVASKLDHGELDAMQSEIIDPAKAEAERIVADARAQADALVRDAEMRKAELVTQIADKEGDLAELDDELSNVQMQVDEETDRLECLRQANDICEGHVEQLESIAADVRGFGDANRAEKVRILDRVAAHCDELREAIYDRLDDLKRVVATAKSRLEFWHRRPSSFDGFIEEQGIEPDGMSFGFDEPARDARGWDDGAR